MKIPRAQNPRRSCVALVAGEFVAGEVVVVVVSVVTALAVVVAATGFVGQNVAVVVDADVS